jgi:hypothetical protein
MKNVLKAFGIIAFLALIGFSMVACSDDSGGGGGGGLAGTTWTYTGTSGSMTLTFTDSTVRLVYPGNSENGTYTFNGSSGTVRWSDGTSNPFTVSGNSLIIDGTTFTKTGGGNTPSGSKGYAGTYTLNPGKDRTTVTLNAAGDWRFDTYDNGHNLYYFTGEPWRASGNEITLYFLGDNVYGTLTIVNSTTLEWHGELFRKQ